MFSFSLLFKDMFEDAVMFCDNFSYLLVAFSNGKILSGVREKSS